MRRIFKRLRRPAALLALLTVLVAQGAVAAERTGRDDLADRFERAKKLIVIIFTRIGWPPG